MLCFILKATQYSVLNSCRQLNILWISCVDPVGIYSPLKTNEILREILKDFFVFDC